MANNGRRFRPRPLRFLTRSSGTLHPWRWNEYDKFDPWLVHGEWVLQNDGRRDSGIHVMGIIDSSTKHGRKHLLSNWTVSRDYRSRSGSKQRLSRNSDCQIAGGLLLQRPFETRNEPNYGTVILGFLDPPNVHHFRAVGPGHRGFLLSIYRKVRYRNKKTHWFAIHSGAKSEPFSTTVAGLNVLPFLPYSTQTFCGWRGT